MIIAVCDPKGIAIEAIKTILYHDKGLSDRISRMPQSLPCFVGTPNTIFYSKNGTCYPIQHHADGIENNKPTKPSMQCGP